MRNPIRIINDNNHPEEPGFWFSGVKPHWFSAMRLKNSQDKSEKIYLVERLYPVAKRISARNKWRVTDERLVAMVVLSVNELYDPVEYVKPSGWLLRAKAMKVSKTAYFKTWYPRYNEIYLELDDWVSRCYRFVRVKQQRGEPLVVDKVGLVT